MKKIKYLLLMVFFFICLVFVFTLSRGDTFVNYGFSYALIIGEIPYKDFNMVILPLAPLIYSLGLFICNNILFYYFEQAILLTILFYIVEKLLKEKAILFLLVLLIPFPIAFSSVIYPGYNFLLLFFFFLFLYFYQTNKSSYLLGLLLGCIFCTKQTVGFFLFLPSFYYLIYDRKKFLKVLVGYCIPILLLGICLFIGNHFYEFVNLCFYGLFDFGYHNQQISIFYFLLLIFGILYILYRIRKEKQNLLLYYALFFSSICFPIIDYYHVSLFLVIVCYFIMEKIPFSKRFSKYIMIFIISICLIWSFVSYQYLGGISFLSQNHFSFVIERREVIENRKEFIKYIDSLDHEVIYFMRGSENYYYKIIHDKKIDYFDLPNYGNYGYQGIEKMKERIEEKHHCYFVLDSKLLKDENPFQQYIKELGFYVIEHSDKIKSIGIYDIYYKE